MFDRFTDAAKKVMSYARHEAMQLHHEYIGTEHLLLGLVRENSGVAANVLQNRNIDLEKIRHEVEQIVKPGPSMASMSQLPFTPRAKKVLELSMEEASQLRHNYLGTEHLLLGLIRENEGIAAQVMMNLGVKLEEVREDVLEFLGEQPAAARTGRDAAGAGAGHEATRPPPDERVLDATIAVLRSEGSEVERFLPPFSIEVERGLAFAVIPPGAAFDELYRNAIEPGLRAAGMTRVDRSTAPTAPGSKPPRVPTELLSAEVLVAVTTGNDPDVLYQLGVCHGRRRCPFLLLAQDDPSAAPAGMQVLRYADGAEGHARLARELAARIRSHLVELGWPR
jgi:hypothetical protein